MVFGFGRHLLNEGVIEERFGLKVVLNSVDHKSLRSIDKTSLGSVPKQTLEQVSREKHPSRRKVGLSFNLFVAVGR